MAAPAELSEAELEAITDPEVLLTHAWELEPWSRYADRTCVLDRLEVVLGQPEAETPPPGRNWRLELLAERAIDVGRSRQVAEANALADRVVREADPQDHVALGRAMLASGQALAWVGTDEATRQAQRVFADAVRLFSAIGNREWQGSTLLRVRTADSTELSLPPGMPGELVRLLALHEHGLPVDVVLEIFFPDAPASAARQRLREVLTRLRSATGELIVRDGEGLRLQPAWVDVREFLAAGNRVRAARGARAVQLAYGALALRSGPLLPTDPYAQWAEEVREQVRYRELAMLDLIAADAAARGSHQEALTALEAAAVQEDPANEDRQGLISEQLLALGHHRTAEHVQRGSATGREV